MDLRILRLDCVGQGTVGWLAEEAIRRYQRRVGKNPDDMVVMEIRKARGCVLLDPEDQVVDVLDDNDFVFVILEGEPSERRSSAAEPDVSDPVASDLWSKSFEKSGETLVLDGQHLTPTDLVLLGKGRTHIRLRKIAEERVAAGRNLVEAILKENRVVYGITTGFGKFARTVISPDKLEELQENLIRSHSAGVGNPLPPERVRMLLALRINVLAKGYSGVSLRTLHQIIAAFNCSCLPWIPEQGTVGASGDLAPLSHLALGMLGEGKVLTASIFGLFKHIASSLMFIGR